MNQRKCKKCDTVNLSTAKYCSQCGYELPNQKISETVVSHQVGKKTNNWGKTISIIIGVIVFVVTFFIVQKYTASLNTFDKQMMKAANDLNKSCPIMIDSRTRLDNAIAMPNKVFQYNYTFLTLERGEIDIDDLRNFIEPNVINNVKTNPEMKEYKENNVTVVYNYRDKHGEFVLKIEVTPDKYHQNH